MYWVLFHRSHDTGQDTDVEQGCLGHTDHSVDNDEYTPEFIAEQEKALATFQKKKRKTKTRTWVKDNTLDINRMPCSPVPSLRRSSRTPTQTQFLTSDFLTQHCSHESFRRRGQIEQSTCLDLKGVPLLSKGLKKQLCECLDLGPEFVRRWDHQKKEIISTHDKNMKVVIQIENTMDFPAGATLEAEVHKTKPYVLQNTGPLQQWLDGIKKAFWAAKTIALGNMFHITLVCMHEQMLVGHLDEPGRCNKYQDVGGDGPGDVILVYHVSGPTATVVFKEWPPRNSHSATVHFRTKPGTMYGFYGKLRHQSKRFVTILSICFQDMQDTMPRTRLRPQRLPLPISNNVPNARTENL